MSIRKKFINPNACRQMTWHSIDDDDKCCDDNRCNCCEEGPQGPQGPQGLRGPQGPAGPTGTCQCENCDCTTQIQNVLEQIATAAAASGNAVKIQINTVNGGTTTGSLSNPSQVGNGIVTLDNGDIVSLCSIAWIRVTGNDTFQSLGITPLPLPEPAQTSCEEVCEKAIRDSLIIGNKYNFLAGGTATGNRFLNVKAVGILFVGVSTSTSDTAISTCQLEVAKPQ